MRYLLSSLALFACSATRVFGFDGDGVLYVSPTGDANNAFGAALALRPEGGFYVAGVAHARGVADAPSLQLRRFDGDGVEDRGFAVALQHAGTMSVSHRGLLVQPDGAVLLAATLSNASSPLDTYTRVLRYSDAGVSDPGFSPFTFDASLGADRLDVLALQLDGRILAAGSVPDASGTGYDAVVARLRADGSLDTAFGDDGFVRVGPAASDTFAGVTYTWLGFTSIALLGDGRILLTGVADTTTGTRTELLFVRLLPDGSRDPSFNGGEPQVYAHRSGNVAGVRTTGGVADVSPDGVFLVGASDTSTGSHRACLLQFDVDGVLSGDACASLGDYDSIADVQLLPNGGGVGVGSFYSGGTTAAVVAIHDAGVQFDGEFVWRFPAADESHDLRAVAFDPVRQRLLSLGTGITQLDGLYSNRWVIASDGLAAALDTEPDPVDGGPMLDAAPGALAGIDRAVVGFDRFVRLPIRVSNGRVDVNGVRTESTDALQPALGFHTDFNDPAAFVMRVEHDAADMPGALRHTRVQVGGVVRSNNLALTVGPRSDVVLSSRAVEGATVGPVFGDGFESLP